MVKKKKKKTFNSFRRGDLPLQDPRCIITWIARNAQRAPRLVVKSGREPRARLWMETRAELKRLALKLIHVGEQMWGTS